MLLWWQVTNYWLEEIGDQQGISLTYLGTVFGLECHWVAKGSSARAQTMGFWEFLFLPLLKSIFFSIRCCPSWPRVPKAQKGADLQLLQHLWPFCPHRWEEQGLPFLSARGFADPWGQVLLSCLAASAPPALALPYVTSERPKIVTFHLLPPPTTLSKDMSSCVTPAHKCTRICKSILLSVCCKITDPDPLARILLQVWTGSSRLLGLFSLEKEKET